MSVTVTEDTVEPSVSWPDYFPDYHMHNELFWATIVCLSVLSCPVYDVRALWACGQTVGRIKMKLGVQVGLGPGHIVLDGDPAPPSQRGTAPPNFRPICCGQMAAWIKMPLGMEVGLSPGDFVLDGDPAP